MAFRITPRIPVHGKFKESPFVEMRYVRLEIYCQEITLLFALFEKASMPSSFQLRRALKSRIRSPELSKYMTFLLNCTPHMLLLAWNNSEELLSEILNWWHRLVTSCGSEDIKMIFKKMFNLEVEWYWDSKQVNGVRDSTIFLSHEEDGSVVLLYYFYWRGSFVEAECGHLHHQYSLFKSAREMMPGPMNQEAFARLKFLCGIENCKWDLAAFAFDLGRAASSLNNSEPISLQQILDLMQRENNPNALKECCQNKPIDQDVFDCNHKLCRKCLTVMLYSSQHICPACESPIRLKYLTDINPAQQVPGVLWRQPLLKCEQCKLDLDLQCYSKARREEYNCRTCDYCMDSPYQYPVDERIVERGGSAMFDSYPSNRTEPMKLEATQTDICKECNERKEINQFSVYCKLEHICFCCDACVYGALDGLPRSCIGCKNVYSDSEKKRLAKTQIGRSLTSIVCLSCKEDKPLSGFSVAMELSHWWKCRVCNSCFQQFRPRGSDECLACREHYFQKDLGIINQQLSRLAVGLPAPICPTEPQQQCSICNPFDTNCLHRKTESRSQREEFMCQKCFAMKILREFSQSQTLQHNGCKVCNSCLEKRENHEFCPACNYRYLRDDLYKIALFSCNSVQKEVKRVEQYCDCGKPKSNFRVNCVNQCVCGICLYTSYLLTNESKCPKCKALISCTFPRFEKCSGCFNQFNLQGRKVLGVCGNGCALCGLCIKVEGESCFCAICSLEVRVRSIQEVKEFQKKYFLACYCDLPFSEMKTLECGHKVHPQCVSTVIRCRLCLIQYQEPKERPTNIIELLINRF